MFNQSFNVNESLRLAPGPSFGALEAIPASGLLVHYSNTAPSMISDGSAWNDISGNSKNLAQATSTSRPTYVASAIGGQPAFEFFGQGSQNDFFRDQTADFIPLGGKTGQTMVVVGQMRIAINFDHIVVELTPTSGFRHNKNPEPQHRDVFNHEGGTALRPILDGSIPVNDPYIMIATINLADTLPGESFDGVARYNGDTGHLTSNTSASSYSSTTDFYIASADATNAFSIRREYIAEILIYDRYLTVAEINSIQNEFATKYSITTSDWLTYNT